MANNVVATAEMTKNNNILLWNFSKKIVEHENQSPYDDDFVKLPNTIEISFKKRANLIGYFNVGISLMAFSSSGNTLAAAGSSNIARVILFDIKNMEAFNEHTSKRSTIIGSHRFVNQYIVALVFDTQDESL